MRRYKVTDWFLLSREGLVTCLIPPFGRPIGMLHRFHASRPAQWNQQALLCMERVDMIFTYTWASGSLPQQSKTERFSQHLFLVHLTWPDVVGTCTNDVLSLPPIQLKESGLFWMSENEPCSLKALIPFWASRIAERRGHRECRIADTQSGSIGGSEPLRN